MYFFGRGVSAFFNQFFKWLFWSKKGQKILFSILIVFIFFVFIKCGEVAAVEEVKDINYEVKSYYNGIVNDVILRLGSGYADGSITIEQIKGLCRNSTYFYYGSVYGTSYNGAKPLNGTSIYIYQWPKSSNLIYYADSSANDYLGVTGYTMYLTKSSTPNNFTISKLLGNSTLTTENKVQVYFPYFISTYVDSDWADFCWKILNSSDDEIVELLTSINESLTNTTPTSETDSFVDVDSSSVDDLSSASVDNVFSNMTTSFSNKFTNYDLDTVYSFVWNLNGTRITFYSDTLYKMIKGTFFETLLSMLWYYIFGHYAFVWLSNIIHKIKDGSILDGLEVNEVITKEML